MKKIHKIRVAKAVDIEDLFEYLHMDWHFLIIRFRYTNPSPIPHK